MEDKKRGRKPWVQHKKSLALGADDYARIKELIQVASVRATENDIILQAIKELYDRTFASNKK